MRWDRWTRPRCPGHEKEPHNPPGQEQHIQAHERKKLTHPVHSTDELSEKKQDDEREATETFNRDFNALEDMDLDEMTKKIRESCKITVEKLNLEHLIQKMSD